MGAIRSILPAASDDSVLWDMEVRTVDPKSAIAGTLPAKDWPTNLVGQLISIAHVGASDGY